METFCLLKCLLVMILFTATFSVVFYYYASILRPEHRVSNLLAGSVSFCDGWRKSFDFIQEEKRIFTSIRMDSAKLAQEFRNGASRLQSISGLLKKKEVELEELELKVQELRLLQKELNERKYVHLQLPNPPLFPSNDKFYKSVPGKKNSIEYHSLEDAIDFSRCSISTMFPVYIYPSTFKYDSQLYHFYNEFLKSRYITMNPEIACIFIALFDASTNITANLSSLKYWKDAGMNHVVLIFGNSEMTVKYGDFKAAMIVSSELTANNFRSELDMAVFLNGVPNYDLNEWQRLPQILPFSRKYFLFFLSTSKGITALEQRNFQALKISLDHSYDSYLIETNCSSFSSSYQNRMGLCFLQDERLDLQKSSLFSLIFPSSSFQQRFYEALLAGSIPVVVGHGQPLPLQDLIDWRLALIQIPSARFPELHFILRSIVPSDIFEMRRKGRFYFENYLSNIRVLTRSILSAIRFRFKMPGLGYTSPISRLLYEDGIVPSFLSTATRPSFDDEFLGPLEISHPSSSYNQNLSTFYLHSYNIWNKFAIDIEFTPQFLLTSHVFPSGTEFGYDTNFDIRPIAPGSGTEFSQSLGGNRPKEQFTIVIITRNRENILQSILENFNNLPYLNKVIIVWNDPDCNPTATLKWPVIHVPIAFIKSSKNSLNNRFLPYDEIETEAVLSVDDDIDLKHYEIILAFRVWRENRDRIVGFPARYHAYYDGETYYNSNYTCQYSLILTGAAFIHKSYFFAYSYRMPEIIREKIDEWMNCEDIAMNFLISHLTRKPPIKTTSKWTIKCPSCTENLSTNEIYYTQRSHCIRFLTHVYGYNPLLYTQFRVDSVLFKTRIPTNHTKCFRFV